MAKIKKCVHKYSELDVQQCIRAIQNHVPIKRACKQYHVPRSTVKYRLGKNWSGRARKGPPTALSEVEEDELVAWIKRMARKGYPITRQHLILAIKQLLSNYPRPEGCKMNAGQRWYQAFMKRHPDLTIRKPEAVSAASATVTEENIRHWFRFVYEILEEEGQSDILNDPHRVFNGDEIGFSLDPETKAVICSKSEKNVYVFDTGSKKNITVLNTYGASGVAVPPCVVLPYQRVPLNVTKSFPSDWGVEKSESGWMTKEAFMGYITNVFHPYLIREKIQLPIVYFVDGHRSHTPFETSEKCVKLGIILISLYANSTHILQPADVAIFRSLKHYFALLWARIWQAEHPGKVVRLDEFGGVLELAIKASFKPQTVINGFRVCGLHPFNADAVDYSKCIAGKHDDQLQQGKADGMEESVLIPSRDIQNAITMISTRKAALYRLAEPDDFTNEAEKALCSIYKTILAPLDERDLPDEESICETVLVEISPDSSVITDETFGALDSGTGGRKDGTTQTDPTTKTLDKALLVSKDKQNLRSSQEQPTSSYCFDFCQMIQQSEIVYSDNLDDLHPLHHVESYAGSMNEVMNSELGSEKVDDSGYETLQATVGSISEVGNGCDVSQQQSVQKESVNPKTTKTFFDEPQTPAKKRKTFKHAKSPPVLTSKKRLELYQAKQAEKENIRKEKQMKVEEKRAERMKKAVLKKLSAITKLEEKLSRLKEDNKTDGVLKNC